MGMREVRVYDGDFPTHDQILSGDPDAKFPKECWRAKLAAGEFAVRYKDFKTGRPRNPTGDHVTSSEICRVFGTLDEAREDSRKTVERNWTVRCFIYDHTGSLTDTISNNKKVLKFAAWTYVGILVWGGGLAIAGMGLVWLFLRAAILISGHQGDTESFFSTYGWIAVVAGGPVLAITGIAAYSLFAASRKQSRMKRNLDAILSPEDKARFAEINTLHGSRDPAERERFLKLAAEYRALVQKAIKK
jgi:hypothetical protein